MTSPSQPPSTISNFTRLLSSRKRSANISQDEPTEAKDAPSTPSLLASSPHQQFRSSRSASAFDDPELPHTRLHTLALASSFPLLAGWLGPISNLFSITALVESWLGEVTEASAASDDNTVEFSGYYDDSAYVVALNAVSLFLGVAANISLLLNFAGRIKYDHSQAISISSFFTASMILVGLTVAEYKNFQHLEYQIVQGAGVEEGIVRIALTQGYWSAVITSVLYFICFFLLAWNEIGHLLGLYPASFILSSHQRSLMLQILAAVLWIASGAGVFSRIEGFSYANAVYYCDVSILTIGLGDIVPVSNLGRAILLPYALIGVLLVGLVVSSVRSLVIGVTRRAQALNKTERLRIHHLSLRNARTSEPDPEISFKVMRSLHRRARRADRWQIFAIALFVFLTFWIVLGALIFSRLQHSWTFFEGLYFTSLCLLTIGYGDFKLTTPGSKAWFVLWSLFAVPMVTILISSMGDTILAAVMKGTAKLGDWALANVNHEHSGTGGTHEPETRSAGAKRRRRRLTLTQPRLLRRAPTSIAPNTEDLWTLVYRRMREDIERQHPELDSSRTSSDSVSEADDSAASLQSDLEKEATVIDAIQRILVDLRRDRHKQYPYEEWQTLSSVLGVDFDWLGADSPIRFPGVDEPALLLRLYWISLTRLLRRRRRRIARREKMQEGSGSEKTAAAADETREEELEDLEMMQQAADEFHMTTVKRSGSKPAAASTAAAASTEEEDDDAADDEEVEIDIMDEDSADEYSSSCSVSD